MMKKEQDLMCAQLLAKVTSGQRLNAAEKAHMVECDECIGILVHHLTKTSESGRSGLAACAETCRNDTPEAQQALAHGRQVFEREFGLVLTRE